MTDIIEEGHDSATVSGVPEEVQQAESSLQRYFQVIEVVVAYSIRKPNIFWW